MSLSQGDVAIIEQFQAERSQLEEDMLDIQGLLDLKRTPAWGELIRRARLKLAEIHAETENEVREEYIRTFLAGARFYRWLIQIDDGTVDVERRLDETAQEQAELGQKMQRWADAPNVGRRGFGSSSPV